MDKNSSRLWSLAQLLPQLISKLKKCKHMNPLQHQNITKLGIQSWKRCMTLAQNCTSMRQLKPIHAIFITHGLHFNNYAISKLLAFCAISNSGNLSYASLLFTQIPKPNSYIYNTLIRAYSRTSSRPYLALHYFNLMLNNNDDENSVVPNHHTFPFVLAACVNAGCMVFGKQIHNWVFKNGIAASDGHVQTALVRFYAEFKVLVDARKVFGEIPVPDVIQWNVLMNGHIKCGLASEGLDIFRDMMVSEVEPDEFCVTTGLTACAQLGALWQGKWIHEYIKKRKGLETDVFVGTTLVDMYAKCGCVDVAFEVFKGMPKRNVFTWAAIIGGFALHGFARKAIHCLEMMQVEDGIRPDEVVLLGVLVACTHAGLLKEGQFLLENMEAQYGVVPKHEHYSCVVDLLCRAGRLNGAFKLIRKMPMKPLASVWGALLSGCRTYHKVDLAEIAVKELLRIENGGGTEEDGAYVQLSNIYFAAQKSEDARGVRRLISDTGLKKTPGCSLIEVNGVAIEFVSGDVSHPYIAHIHAILELIFPRLCLDYPLSKNITTEKFDICMH